MKRGSHCWKLLWRRRKKGKKQTNKQTNKHPPKKQKKKREKARRERHTLLEKRFPLLILHFTKPQSILTEYANDVELGLQTYII